MYINRRKLRRGLGTRKTRRAGTKSQGIPGTAGEGNKFSHYRIPRRRGERPAVALERRVRQILREARS